MAGVRWDHVTKRFGDVTAVDGADLAVDDREFMILLGPSGCGKSTLLRLLAGLEQPTAGHVFIGDRQVDDIAAKDRDVAMVFQSYALYPHKTVRANIEFPLKVRKVPAAERGERVMQAATALGLGDLLDRKPAALSGGQRQRVALARAIVRQPAVFCMDEPLSNLDAKLRADTRAELVALHRRLDATFIYVTHDQVEAMTMADKIVVMQGGKIEQVGAPLELYDRPANTFVAAFIGSPSMNMIDGVVQGGMVRAGGATLPLPPGMQVAEGREVIYGIRPENLGHAAQGITGTVAVVEPTGAETHVVVRIEGRELTAVFRDRVSHRPGDAITLAPSDPASVHLFDKSSGTRF